MFLSFSNMLFVDYFRLETSFGLRVQRPGRKGVSVGPGRCPRWVWPGVTHTHSAGTATGPRRQCRVNRAGRGSPAFPHWVAGLHPGSTRSEAGTAPWPLQAVAVPRLPLPCMALTLQRDLSRILCLTSFPRAWCFLTVELRLRDVPSSILLLRENIVSHLLILVT